MFSSTFSPVSSWQKLVGFFLLAGISAMVFAEVYRQIKRKV